MQQENKDLKLELELFEGPMDLLLYLIKKNHIDIQDIPIADVLSQYLEYIEMMRLCDINVASEYLVIAASLIQIKAKMLIPQNEKSVEDGDEEDPRDELVRRLMEYQKFKEAAEFLRDKETIMNKQVVRADTIGDYRPEGLCFEASMYDLISAFQDALKKIPKEVFFEVMKDEYTVEEKIDYISEILRDQSRISISELFSKVKTKMELITTFLAVLELVKLRKASAVQEELFGSITLVKENGTRDE
jgi:segregation and condensation protein A